MTITKRTRGSGEPTACFSGDLARDVDEWAAPEFLEQAAKELLAEQWKKVTTAKLPETTELLAETKRMG